MNNKKNNNFILNGSILALSAILCKIIGIIYRIPLQRIIGDEGNAIYGIAFEVYNIGIFLSSYSLPLAVSKIISKRESRGDINGVKKAFRASLIFSVIVGGFVSVVIYVFAGFIGSSIMRSPLIIYALRVLAPGLFIVSVMGVIRGYFQGVGEFSYTGISQIVEQVFNAIVSILAAIYLTKMGGDLQSSLNYKDKIFFMFSYVNLEFIKKDTNLKTLLPSAFGAAGGTLGTLFGSIFGLLTLIILYYFYKKKRVITENKILKCGKYLKINRREESYKKISIILIATMIPVIMSGLIYNVITLFDQGIFNGYVSVKGLDVINSTKNMGVYTGKCMTIINIPLAISASLSAALIPAFSSESLKNNKKIINRKIKRAVDFSLLITIPCTIGIIVLSSPILLFLYDDERTLSSVLLILTSLGIVFYSVASIITATLQGLGEMITPIKNAFIALIIHTVFIFIGLYLFSLDIYTLPLGNLVFSMSVSIMNFISINKLTKYNINIKSSVLFPLVCSLIMGVFVLLIYYLLRSILGNKISLVLSILGGVGAYIVSIGNLQFIFKEKEKRVRNGNIRR